MLTAGLHNSRGQVKSPHPVLKWSTWALMQAIPSFTVFEDRNVSNSGLRFGLQWQVTPISYSFNANKYVSKFNFFFIEPEKRFSGSFESFFEPEFATGEFKYAGIKRFMYKAGGRVVLPVAQRGEYLSFSLGAGYYNQQNNDGRNIGGVTYEAAVYSFFGMLGLKFNYNQNAPSKYNIGIYIKYF